MRSVPDRSVSGRFLLALIDGGGTVPPALGLAAELLRRGHQVHVLSDPIVEPHARAVGCEFSPWREAPHFDSRAEQSALLAAAEGGNPYRAVRALRAYVGKAMTSRFAEDVVATVGESPVDAVLCDGIPGMLLGGQATGLPTAALLANVYPRPTPGLPLIGTGWSPSGGKVTRTRDRLAPGIAIWLLKRTLRRINRAATTQGQAPLDDVFELFDRCRRVLVMTSPSFDFVGPLLPSNVRYVGPQVDDPPWAAAVEWTRCGSKPLALVGMSSIYQGQTEVLRRVAQGLGQLPITAVLTTGSAIGPDEVDAPSNVQVLPAAPHRRILGEASVVVTHAGHGTVMKALAAGVPLVCMPMGRDQKDNAVRVLRLGAGLRISPRSSPDNIAEAVSEVLQNSSYTAAARAFAAVLASEAASRPSAADEAEGLLRADASR
jgi:UDP:flavonoid glycosyltransferase YjiC (YdhE family)